MLGMKLVRLIERHSETLARQLAEQIRHSERTADFRQIPAEELRLAATDVYRNLGEWLLQKTEPEIARRFKSIAAQRAAEGIRVHQFVWALMLTRDHLFQFLEREAFADTIVELHGELELHQLLNQFFDRAVFYGIQGYERRAQIKGDLQRVHDFAVAVGLMAERQATEMVKD